MHPKRKNELESLKYTISNAYSGGLQKNLHPARFQREHLRPAKNSNSHNKLHKTSVYLDNYCDFMALRPYDSTA